MTDYTDEERELAEWLYNNCPGYGGSKYENWLRCARELLKMQKDKVDSLRRELYREMHECQNLAELSDDIQSEREYEACCSAYHHSIELLGKCFPINTQSVSAGLSLCPNSKCGCMTKDVEVLNVGVFCGKCHTNKK